MAQSCTALVVTCSSVLGERTKEGLDEILMLHPCSLEHMVKEEGGVSGGREGRREQKLKGNRERGCGGDRAKGFEERGRGRWKERGRRCHVSNKKKML